MAVSTPRTRPWNPGRVPARWLLLGLAALAFICLVAFWSLAGKYVLLQGKLEDTKHALTQGPLVQPAVDKLVALVDRAVVRGQLSSRDAVSAVS